jgi:hypothetical protein
MAIARSIAGRIQKGLRVNWGCLGAGEMPLDEVKRILV